MPTARTALLVLVLSITGAGRAQGIAQFLLWSDEAMRTGDQITFAAGPGVEGTVKDVTYFPTQDGLIVNAAAQTAKVKDGSFTVAVAAEKKVRGWLAKDEKLSLGGRVWKAKDLLDRIERELQR